MSDMEELFYEVLALCLDRVADGDSPAACAAEFPEFPDLLPLLELALQLSSRPQPEVDPVWLTDSRDRLSARIAERSSTRLAEPPSDAE